MLVYRTLTRRRRSVCFQENHKCVWLSSHARLTIELIRPRGTHLTGGRQSLTDASNTYLMSHSSGPIIYAMNLSSHLQALTQVSGPRSRQVVCLRKGCSSFKRSVRTTVSLRMEPREEAIE